MPDTARLYALTSTITHPFLTGEDGPTLLIHDPALAMRWYLSHEQEDNLAVTVQASDDGGRTWRPLPVHDLRTDAEHAQDTSGQAELLRDAAADLAATWLDRRIRFVPADDPTPWPPDRPEPDGWQRGGQAWALAMNTLPPDALLARLTAHYTDPQPDGPGLLRDAATETLHALALAAHPDTAPVEDLLNALALLERLTYSFALGQLRDRADRAQHLLVQALTGRVEPVAAALTTHPDPRHPVHEAARAYLKQLARAGTEPHPQPVAQALARARDALTDALTTPASVPGPAPAATVPGNERLAPLPGFPVQFTDPQAAAAWRALSPMARRDAELAMEDLVRADVAVLKAAAAAAAWDGGRPRDAAEAAAFDRLSPLQQRLQRQAVHSGEAHARDNRRFLQDRLDDLDARHALLMHAAVLHDAEQGATTARHHAVIAASDATLPPAGTSRTVVESLAEHDAFMAHVTAAEERIDRVLQTQRQLIRDALQRLFPRSGHALGMHELRTQLLERSRLGLDEYHRAYQQIGATRRTLDDLRAQFTSGRTQFGRPVVTEEDIAQARDRRQHAEQYFNDLWESRRITLLALNALDTVATLSPTPPGTAAERAARIKAQSRQRAQLPPAEGPRREDPARAQRQHVHPAQHAPAIRPS